MVEVGANIQARVNRLEPYGVWLKHNQEDVLVLITEVSWKPCMCPSEFAQIGDTVEVRVLRYNYKDRVIVGSFKALHPEENPYRKLARLEPGEILRGKVCTIYDDEVKVDLPDGAFGKIPKHRSSHALKVGDVVEATILSLEVDQGLLNLDLVERKPKVPTPVNQPAPVHPVESVA